jgi:hypothetical protein
LRGSVFAQLGHFIGTAFRGFLLLALAPAFCFVTLSLLPGLFFLAFRER